MLSRRRTIGAGLSTLGIIAAGGQSALASPLAVGGLKSDDDWVVASPGSQGIPGTNLDKLLDDASSIRKLRGIVVTRNGYLVGERYYGGASMADPKAIYSVTKRRFHAHRSRDRPRPSRALPRHSEISFLKRRGNHQPPPSIM
jgi:hypothetical protein